MTLRTTAAMALLLAACSGTTAGSSSTTTTTEPATPSSSTTTTTSEPETSTSTTTTSSTTSTTVRATGLPEGFAVISSQGGIMGIWDGDWTVIEDAADLPELDPDWQVFTAVGGAIEMQPGELVEGSSFCEIAPYDRPVVSIDGQVFFANPWLAVQAGWEIVPHKVEDFTGQLEVYVQAVIDLLAGQGLDVTTAHLEQLIRFDLEGDGVDEVIVVATEGVRDDIYSPATDQPFELVILRKVIEGEVRTAILALRLPSDILLEQGEDLPPFPFLFEWEVMGIADLNGDGKMEIALRDQYYEGAGLRIWEYVNDDLGPVPVLDLGCGA